MSLIRMKNQEKIKALLNGMHVHMQGNGMNIEFLCYREVEALVYFEIWEWDTVT